MNSTKFSFVTLSVLLAVLAGLLAFGIWSMRDKNRKAHELTHVAEDAASAEILLQHVRSAKNSSAEDIAAFESFMLTGDKLVPLIESMQGAGRSLGLETEIVSVSESEEGVLPATVQIAIEARGPWASSMSFLRALESLPHRVMMREVEINRGDGAIWSIRVILALNVFSL